MNLLQRQHPEILAGIGVGYEKSGFWSKKSSNISEMWQDRTNVTVEDQQEVTRVLSIGATVNDLR